jgi:hypothetical protein
MAYEIPVLDITLTAAADLSAKQYFAVAVDTNGKAALAGAGVQAIGILQNKPIAGAAAQVRVYGISKMVAGAVVAKGAAVAADTNGKAKAAVAATVNTSDAGAAGDPVVGSYALGIALESAAADLNVITVAILQMGAIPTTAA